MMKKVIYMILMAGLLLAACSGAPAEENTALQDESQPVSDSDTALEPVEESNDTAESVRLNTDYDNALPVDTQLTIGTMMLETTEYSIDAAQAAELLPLWKMAQALDTSDTASDVEIEAIMNQIEDGMSPEQIAAIAAMQLTTENSGDIMQEMRESMRAEGQQGDGTGQRPAGGPGGDMPEGLRPQGMGSGEQMSPEQMETMQAMRESGEMGGGMMNSAGMYRQVISLLERIISE